MSFLEQEEELEKHLIMQGVYSKESSSQEGTLGQWSASIS
jgi:hypothetical protein